MWTFWLVIGLQIAVLASVTALLARKLKLWKAVLVLCLWSWVGAALYGHLDDADRDRLAARPTQWVANAYGDVPSRPLGYVNLTKETIGCVTPQAAAVIATFTGQDVTEVLSKYLTDPASGRDTCKILPYDAFLWVDGFDQRNGVELLHVREKDSSGPLYIAKHR
jgi:hypothetical protein